MRAWIVVLVLAGCAAPAGPVAPDETQPIHAPHDAYRLLGPQTNSTPDAWVVIGLCGSSSNLHAYTIDVSTWPVQRELPLRAVGTPNATSFAIVAFLPGPDGLVEAARWVGGSDTVAGHHDYYVDWPISMPERIDVPVDDEGIVRLAIGCKGNGAINYFWGDEAPERPDYLEPVVASGAAAFLAFGTDALFSNGILPSQSLIVGSVWSTIGGVRVTHENPLPPVQDAVRVQTDSIEWTGGAGWTTVRCSHTGWSDHGTWSYEADLHGDARRHDGTMAYDIAALWLTQTILFGQIQVEHTADGTAEGRLRFEVRHLASASVGWFTMCDGIHLGAPLQELFGQQGATGWVWPRGLVA